MTEIASDSRWAESRCRGFERCHNLCVHEEGYISITLAFLLFLSEPQDGDETGQSRRIHHVRIDVIYKFSNALPTQSLSLPQ
jgi:hypothetical protein